MPHYLNAILLTPKKKQLIYMIGRLFTYVQEVGSITKYLKEKVIQLQWEKAKCNNPHFWAVLLLAILVTPSTRDSDHNVTISHTSLYRNIFAYSITITTHCTC
ncbi:hypothetical protein Hdeb2414_s0003g00110161 [Helianthus debilis subsp. tardiflorus]